MLRAVLTLILLAASAAPARALFIADELDELDTERLFDSEYFLDLESFDYPLEWHWLWRGSSVGYRINGASLDRSDLLLNQEARMQAQALDWVSFKYHLVHNGDKDVVDLHQFLMVEFGPCPLSGTSVAIIGEPSFDKEHSDIGLLVRQRISEGWMAYGSVNAVDFTFNKRGETTQRYDRKPYTYELGTGLDMGEGKLFGVLELDSLLRLQMPDSNRDYHYRRTRLRIGYDRPGHDRGWGWRAGYTYEFKREGDDFLPDPTTLTSEFHRKVHSLEVAADKPFGERDRFEAGSRLMVRRAESDFAGAPARGIRHHRWELQPRARWRRMLKPWAQSEVALFMAMGERRRFYDDAAAATSTDTLIEAKLGLGMDFVYGRRGRIGLYGTFDLDEFGSHLWDGGNIRTMFLF